MDTGMYITMAYMFGFMFGLGMGYLLSPTTPIVTKRENKTVAEEMKPLFRRIQ